MKKILLVVQCWIARWFGTESLDKELVIVRFDGGVCSQLAFWALCKDLQDKGLRVKSDLCWYRENGADMNGLHVRNFDIDKAFPSLAIQEASKLEREYYKLFYRYPGESLDGLESPAYLGGYYQRWPLLLKYRSQIMESLCIPSSELDQENRRALDDICSQTNACAVHVRRGDLSQVNPVYGEPLGVDYYIDAISKIESMVPGVKFFFFSDEPDWVKEHILTGKGSSFEYLVIDFNGSDKGYLDLYLMIHCSSYISSHGSLAKYARAISGNNQLIVEPESRAMFDREETNVHRV